jgi:hypothetical protein
LAKPKTKSMLVGAVLGDALTLALTVLFWEWRGVLGVLLYFTVRSIVSLVREASRG